MKIGDLLDLTLREILDEYCVLFNLECAYYYGVTTFENANRMCEEFNIEEEYPEAMSVENLISDEILINLDDELVDWDKIVRIMNNLGVGRKV